MARSLRVAFVALVALLAVHVAFAADECPITSEQASSIDYSTIKSSCVRDAGAPGFAAAISGAALAWACGWGTGVDRAARGRPGSPLPTRFWAIPAGVRAAAGVLRRRGRSGQLGPSRGGSWKEAQDDEVCAALRAAPRPCARRGRREANRGGSCPAARADRGSGERGGGDGGPARHTEA